MPSRNWIKTVSQALGISVKSHHYVGTVIDKGSLCQAFAVGYEGENGQEFACVIGTRIVFKGLHSVKAISLRLKNTSKAVDTKALMPYCQHKGF